ncbi:MAG: efflux RND transporter periplasmic adaptor subunit [Acidaminococcaceae bacterium]|nr:efflux RND transporter periplasmic adaptor subunit [Acidaminococcaceae bacterium]
MDNKKKLLVAVLLVFFAAAGFYFYQNYRKDSGPLTLYGNVDIRQISLAFNASERIDKMMKEEGDAVKTGEVMAVLNTRTLELNIARSKAAIAQQEAVVAKLHNGSRPEEILQAEAGVNTMAAEENNARTNYERMRKLADQGAVSRQTLDDAEARWKAAAANLENAKAALRLSNIGPRAEDIAAAEAQLKALKVELENHEYNLSQATLKAPQDGVVRSRLLEPGDMASPQKAVYMIGLENTKWVRAYIPEKRLGEVKEGMEAKVYIDSFPNDPIKGQVGYISGTAEFTPKSVQTEELRTSLLYEVRIYVEDKENRLRMGMPATVKF